MWAFVLAHWTYFLLGGYWVFSAAVSAMPDPMPNGGQGYLWAFRFLHTIAGNLSTVIGTKIPK